MQHMYLDSCFKVASLGGLGAMLGRLPSLSREKTLMQRINEARVPPDPLMVYGVEGGLTAERRVAAYRASVVVRHLQVERFTSL